MFLGAQWQTLLELTVHILSLGSFLIFFFCAASLSKSVILFINFSLSFLFYFFKDFIYLFLGRGEGKEKERERNINVWLLLTCLPIGDLAHNPGMFPDWESTGNLSFTGQCSIH